jgi:hypothetical protein
MFETLLFMIQNEKTSLNFGPSSDHRRTFQVKNLKKAKELGGARLASQNAAKSGCHIFFALRVDVWAGFFWMTRNGWVEQNGGFIWD